MSQLALHTSKAVLCARLQAVALHFSRIFFSPPGSTQPCSRELAKPCHNSHPLPALHSVANSPNTRKEEECSSFDPGLCYSTSFGTCSYEQKEVYFAPPIPKALCQRIMPPRSMVSTHQLCVRPDLDYSPELAWFPPPFRPASKGRSH